MELAATAVMEEMEMVVVVIGAPTQVPHQPAWMVEILSVVLRRAPMEISLVDRHPVMG
jgi:hypothetical protein